MTPVAVGNLEENSVIGSPHQLQANDLLVEPLHGIQVGHTQRYFTQRFDPLHEPNLPVLIARASDVFTPAVAANRTRR
jgi:hypothetical protein